PRWVYPTGAEVQQLTLRSPKKRPRWVYPTGAEVQWLISCIPHSPDSGTIRGNRNTHLKNKFAYPTRLSIIEIKRGSISYLIQLRLASYASVRGDTMEIRLKISLANDKGETFMGIGLVWLLREIDRRGSINRASKALDLSYSKALKIINHLEENLGRKLLIRKHGGYDRGGAELTPFGRKFIKKYDLMQSSIKESAGKDFSRFRDDINKT
ncbi:MAG: LysR family transcriptional regulator, partial [Candidatus Auribacterota bacterium]|nr:LysR family transcriptional regulator [Candidatus Auribacterota bacterium]